MRTCIFCAGRAGSREHIIPQWMIDRMEARTGAMVVALRDEGKVTERPAAPLGSYTCKEVCRRCNNGWMSELEAWSQKAVGPLVEPDWPRLSCEILKTALQERETFAKWALKTAIMMDRTTLMGEVIDDETPRTLHAGRVAAGVTIDIAHIHARHVKSILSYGFWVSPDDGPPRWKAHQGGMAFKVVMQFNHLAIRVFRTPGARRSYVGNHNRLPLRAYPEVMSPYDTDFRYHDLEEFDLCLGLLP